MQEIVDKMEKAGCSPAQVQRFCARVEEFLSGAELTIAESEIRPVESLPKLEDLEPQPELLRQTAQIKLNGGLGTSMGLTGPKGLLEVKGGMDFYAICHHQVEQMARREGFRPPLLFMNSFNTEEATEERLRSLGFKQDPPWGFLQSQVPKICPDGSLPEVEEEFAWCPPGHGDLYATLLDNGLAERLQREGVRFLFVSNIDNLGATLDSRPVAHMLNNRLPFLMEVTRRGDNDKKGGHLAQNVEGGLLLREVAQCPERDMEAFQDIERHKFFNTNNLWLDLQALDESWTQLPLIVNRKPVYPHRPNSTQVVQLEQAMGAAIGVVPGAAAVEVGRDRFVPVKSTNELLLLRSDAYELSEDYTLRAAKKDLPRVDLDPEHYRLIEDFERLVEGAPSLLACQSLQVRGPVRLHGDMKLSGEVQLSN